MSVLHDFAYTCTHLARSQNPAYPCENTYMTVAIESIKDLSHVSTLSGKGPLQVIEGSQQYSLKYSYMSCVS